MAVTFRTNIGVLSGISQLNRSSADLQTSFERLSTGLRINKAGDDPAGLAVAGKIGAQSKVLQRGQLNINDGISLLNIADAALSEVNGLLTRMSELAAQAASGTYSKEQRKALQLEYSALDQEIRRIADSTEFNGRSLFKAGPNTKAGVYLATESAPTADPYGTYVNYKDGSNPSFISLIEIGSGSIYQLDPASLKSGGAIGAQTFTSDGKVIFSVFDASSRDIYIWDPGTDNVEQLTNSQSAVGGSVMTVSGDESILLFSSRTVYEDGGTAASASAPDGTTRLYALDLVTGIIRTNGEAVTSASGHISADGTQIGYRSNNTYYTAQLSSSGMSSFSLVGDVNGATILGIKDNGDSIARSLNDLAGTGNSVNNIFLLDQNTGTFSQITNISVTNTQDGLALSPDGSFLTFASGADITGENPSGFRQFFRANLLTGEVEQLTQLTQGINFVGGITRDGTLGVARVDTDIYLFDLTSDPIQYDLEIGFGATGRIVAELSAIEGNLLGLGALPITSQKSAQRALGFLRENIELLGQIGGDIGASMSRLGSASRVLAAQREALQGAKSRIEDADLATESAGLVSNSIRQNATTAILAQANQQVGVSLRLLELSGIS